MKSKLLFIVMLGVTAIAEAYLFGVADVMHLHGLGFIGGMSAAIILPVLDVFLAIKAFKSEKITPREIVFVEDEPLDLADTAISSLKKVASTKPAMAVDARKAAEQVERFGDKINALEGYRDSDGRVMTLISSSQNVFYKRIEEFLRIAVSFDIDEYVQFRKGELELKDKELIQKKQEIFDRKFKGVDKITDDNEALILQIDELLDVLTRKTNDSAWDTSTQMSLSKMADYIDKIEDGTEMDKTASFNALKALKGINQYKNEFSLGGANEKK